MKGSLWTILPRTLLVSVRALGLALLSVAMIAGAVQALLSAQSAEGAAQVVAWTVVGGWACLAWLAWSAFRVTLVAVAVARSLKRPLGWGPWFQLLPNWIPVRSPLKDQALAYSLAESVVEPAEALAGFVALGRERLPQRLLSPLEQGFLKWVFPILVGGFLLAALSLETVGGAATAWGLISGWLVVFLTTVYSQVSRKLIEALLVVQAVDGAVPRDKLVELARQAGLVES